MDFFVKHFGRSLREIFRVHPPAKIHPLIRLRRSCVEQMEKQVSCPVMEEVLNEIGFIESSDLNRATYLFINLFFSIDINTHRNTSDVFSIAPDFETKQWIVGPVTHHVPLGSMRYLVRRALVVPKWNGW